MKAHHEAYEGRKEYYLLNHMCDFCDFAIIRFTQIEENLTWRTDQGNHGLYRLL